MRREVWQPNCLTCPKCGHRTEGFWRFDGIVLAERCSRCRWQINFQPKPRKVQYGTAPEGGDENEQQADAV